MTPELHRREKEGIQILDLHGSLAAGDLESTLRTALPAAMDECVEAGAGNVILNLTGVPEIDEGGLGILSCCCASLAKSGGSLKLLNVNLPDPSLIVLTRLHTMCEVFSDEQEAVNSFFPDRVIPNFDILEWVQEQEGFPQPIFEAA